MFEKTQNMKKKSGKQEKFKFNLETPVDDSVGAGFGGASVGSVVRVEVGARNPIGSGKISCDFGDWDSARVVGP